jgi:hypothetical protein
MKLIYRALVLESAPCPVMPYSITASIKLALSCSRELYGVAQKPITSYRYPQVLNWCFRMAVEG